MLQRLLPRGNATVSTVGVQLSGDGISLAIDSAVAPDRARGGQTSSVSCHPADWRAQLDVLARDLGLPKGTPANLVLPPDSYALLLLEPPDVPPSELRDAVRWRVRELVPFNVDDAVLDLFPFPEEAAKGRKTCFVAVAERKALQPRVDAFRDSRLALRSIDITELALRNLIPDEVEEPIAVLYAQGQIGLIALFKAGRLFLSRRLEVRDVGDDRTVDQVLLQLQRSMDYFDSQLGQGVVNTVLSCMPAEFEREGIRRLQEMLPFPVHRLGDWLEQRGSGPVQSGMAVATGGARRRAA
jgi:MSHA biogenesis protein MshI